ncbi:MAG: hypothetical protein VX236_06510 [Pseudomonadota bacterium]|nr:hypothetical protein [Pseudomonadota bacterium]
MSSRCGKVASVIDQYPIDTMHYEPLVIPAIRRAPIGASGARILLNQLHVLRNHGGGKGIGGGKPS